MKKRSGGKFGTSHSTMTEAAAIISDIAVKCPCIKRVIHSIISIPRGSSGHSRRVKMRQDGHSLRVSVSAGASHQELFVFTNDISEAQKFIKEGAEKKRFAVTIV